MTWMNTRMTLLGKVKDKHDDQSWEDFVSFYKRYIAGIVHNMRIPADEVDDIVQTVLLQVWKKLPEFEYNPSQGKFRNWLATITVNRVRDAQRKFGRKNEIIETNESYPTDNTSKPEIEEIANEEWLKHISNLAWERIEPTLAPSVHKAFTLYLKGVPDKDIANELELAESSIRVYRSRVEQLMIREVATLERELS
ncbi:MAG: sigma-70 family RNA polymerase sigma factor [Lentisphaeraceae bacterium]|nr:sigma-70 family RNA polymerase sigma factor [Lentisphaeraceae bacterium]